MLHKLLESSIGPITKSELKEVLDLATDDIRVNRIAFGQRTNLSEAIQIAISCHKLLQRIKKAA